MNGTNVNIAVAGCGSWGRNLARNFVDPGALRLVCDVGSAQFQSLGAEAAQLMTPSPVRGTPRIIEVGEVKPPRLECQQFLNCIQHRRNPNTDGPNGVEVLQILEACQISLEQRNIPVNTHV